ncbi:hypothetical protein HYH02_012613 [Chlamydomonas schloesseri]|uniref:non-specific serine/threonine protein kinase n=1 Tax=Chlamydomonas schloesseri TaxID=2026947 RepID=A0A835VZC9_9CHLO|nr:hypothetical protein HYH02_012613 [Chlamydomonas schloesseri]|eukprot:KAG2433495.1 hypothetical protein HYH02_012613 [Chlamydomonas schloesseri]
MQYQQGAPYQQYAPPQPTSEEHAISIALAQSVVDHEAWRHRERELQAAQAHRVVKSSAAEALSQKFWREGSLGYGEVVADGFYDIFGDFPEVCEGPNQFPALADLRKVRTGSGDVREVVLVDHEEDQGLLAVEEQLSEAMEEAKPADVAARIQVVARVVCERFGGAYDTEAALDHFWHASSAAEKRRTRSAVVPLCRLDVGSARHRALLFKVLADAAKLPCRLVRGAALCGSEAGVAALVAVPAPTGGGSRGGGEWVVDLVYEPGRLYTPQEYCAMVRAKRMRSESWHRNGSASALTAGVETSAVSSSSASSVATVSTPAAAAAAAAAASEALGPASGHLLPPHSVSTSSLPSTAAAAGGSGGAAVAAGGSGHGAAAQAGVGSSQSTPALTSPPTAHPRPTVSVPPVPGPGAFSSSLPNPGGMGGPGTLHGHGQHGGGVWGSGLGLQQGHGGGGGGGGGGAGPAIAGSRVRFTITDLPKSGSGAAHLATAITTAASSSPHGHPSALGAGGHAAPGALHSSGGSAGATVGSAPHASSHVPHVRIGPVAAGPTGGAGAFQHRAAIAPPPGTAVAGPGPGSGAAAGATGVGVGASSAARHGGGCGGLAGLAPSKARSMLDLHGSGGGGGGDLIRLDSEPLPPPEVCPTPTGGAVGGAHTGVPTFHKHQGSLDANGWVKFSGSFGRSPTPHKDEGAAHGHNPSRLSHQGAPPPSVAPTGQLGAAILASAVANGVTTNPPQQLQAQPQRPPHHPQLPTHMESSASLTSLPNAPSTADSANASNGGAVATGRGSNGSSAGMASASSSGLASQPTLSSMPPSGLPVVTTGATGLSSASPFAHFVLPAGLSLAAGVGPGQPGAAGATGGGGGLSTEATVSSAGSTQGGAAQGGAGGAAVTPAPASAPVPGKPPAATVSAASPFQAAQLGLGAGVGATQRSSLPQHLASSFPTLHPQHQPLPQLASQPQAAAAAPLGARPHAGVPPPSFPGGGFMPHAATTTITTGGGNTHAMYTPPPKDAPAAGGGGGGGGGGGSKAPSPALSTPTPLALTASSAQSTPGNAAPVESIPFADLSPWYNGSTSTGTGTGTGGNPAAAGATGAGSAGPKSGGTGNRQGGAGAGLLPPAQASTASAAAGSDPAEDKAAAKARNATFFADLSPFNNGAPAAGAGGAGGRDNTPPGGHVRGPAGRQSPIVEMPSSDNSRDATPRVSFTNTSDNSHMLLQGGGGAGGGGGPSSWSESTFDMMGRLRIGGGATATGMGMGMGMAGGRADVSVGRLGSHAHHASTGSGGSGGGGQLVLHTQPHQMQLANTSGAGGQQGQQQQFAPMGQAMGAGTGLGQAAAAAAVAEQQRQREMAIALYQQGMMGGPNSLQLISQAMALAQAAGMINLNPTPGAGAMTNLVNMQQMHMMQQHMNMQQQQQMQQQSPFGAPGGWPHAHGLGGHGAQQQQQQPLALQGPPQMGLLGMGPGGGMGGAAPHAPGTALHPWAAQAWVAANQHQQQQQQQQPQMQLQQQVPTFQPQFPPAQPTGAGGATQQQQQQRQQSAFMMHSAFMQQQQQQAVAQQQQQQHQQQQQQQQAHMERNSSFATTTTTTTTVVRQTTQVVETSAAAAAAPAPAAGGSAFAAAGAAAGIGLAHEMTVPSASRLAAMQAAAAAAAAGGVSAVSDGGAAGGTTSPLGLQPTLSVTSTMPLPPNYKDLEIDPKELTLGQRIGIGSYGEVYKGSWRGTEVAVKRFLEQNLSPPTIRDFRDEVLIMSKLRHPNIVLFMGAVTQSNQLAIVTQFVARGSLFRLLHRTKEVLDPRRRLNMALDIAKGMEYLHNCKPVLVHRDLKSPNLLVDRDWTVKVCDFGLSKVKMDTFLTAKTQGGSPAWMAPEILRSERCDEKSDVFSFGVILYELVTGREPWEELNPMQVVGVVGFNGQRMDLPPDLDPGVTALITACWADKPADRPSFSQILATLTTWSELRPTAEVMERQAASVRARQARQQGGAGGGGGGGA